MPDLPEKQNRVAELARRRGLDMNKRIHHDDPDAPRIRDLARGEHPKYERTIDTWLRLLEEGPS